MVKAIDGVCFRQMIEYGVKNLEAHRREINRINVFPVPDGDTGTNMVVTVRNGLAALSTDETSLSTIARKFSRAVVFGARGNSGVIFSQFLGGMSECFAESESADCRLFSASLGSGVRRAYGAVSEPVEGTMLTVLRDATDAVVKSEETDPETLISLFVESARKSVELTPTLLPVLLSSGVVDSGGAGVVRFFEGIKKYFDGEGIGESESDGNEAQSAPDVSVFNRKSEFEYGYCTEALLQLLARMEPLSEQRFRLDLGELGESVAVSVGEDKAKIHVHTQSPEQILEYCHRFGEFLTLKIENMTVQNVASKEGDGYSSPDDAGFIPQVGSFNKNSLFEYGYCTEALIQLLDAKEGLDEDRFRRDLGEMGESVAVSFEDSKVKVHVHTPYPEQMLGYCHRFGEFLTLKIENMTVQNAAAKETIPYYSLREGKRACAIVALAADGETQRLFGDMGADAAIRCDRGVSPEDFSELFDCLGAKAIVVFPCSKESLSAAKKIAREYDKRPVEVVSSTDVPRCCAALAMVDFDKEDPEKIRIAADRAIGSLFTVRIICEDGRLFTLTDNGERKEAARGESLSDVTVRTAKEYADKSENCVITLYGGQKTDSKELEYLCAALAEACPGYDADFISTGDRSFYVIISFE